MTKYFQASKLVELIKPYSLVDVLSSLTDNGLVEEWDWDTEEDIISITISKGAEISRVLETFEKYHESGKRRLQ